MITCQDKILLLEVLALIIYPQLTNNTLKAINMDLDMVLLMDRDMAPLMEFQLIKVLYMRQWVIFQQLAVMLQDTKQDLLVKADRL